MDGKTKKKDGKTKKKDGKTTEFAYAYSAFSP